MRHRHFVALLVVAVVVGVGGCSTVPKHDAASVPPTTGGDDGSYHGSFFYVGGEVKYPSRQIFGGRITLLKAIACAGGFAPSANKKKVQLTRYAGERRIIACASAERHPELDVQIYPGDSIYVPRSAKWLFW